MMQKKWGRIITLSSVAALMGAWMQPSYGATKAGLLGLTKSLAIEGGRYGITVNAVAPGFIATESVQLHDSQMLERVRKRTPLRRLGRPEEVAPVVVFLAFEAASFITGATIPVTGGIDLLTF
jgi:3-oxoacyl-[acyl-carrier protein] reductase